MCTRDLPNIYALTLERCAPLGIVRIYQAIANPLYPCYNLSLSTVVLNSRDGHERTWRPTFAHLHNTPHNMLPKKMTKMH